MKMFKKLVSLGLGLTLTVGMLAGCGSAEEAGGKDAAASAPAKQEASAGAEAGGKTYNGVDVSEHVDLTMYLIGDRTADFDEVYGKINEILEEKLNCSISVEFLSWGEHDTKYSMLFSSQEDFDLIFTASSWCHYEQTVALGGFYEMTPEFIQTYAPDIWEVVPEMAWDQAKIDGKIYMVPNYQNEFGQDVIAVRGDLMEKYGYEDITSWDELKSFYMDVAAGEENIFACGGGPTYQYWQSQGLTVTSGTPKGGELILYNTQDSSDLSFTYVMDWDGFLDYCKQAKEMLDAGCWSQDVLSSTDERQTGLLSGKSAAMVWNLGSCMNYAKQANAEHPEWKVTLCDPVAAQDKKVNSYINNGVAINLNSENPERAMMVLNEFYTNQEVNDLTRLGIEGKHWEAAGDNQYKVLDAMGGYGVDSNCNWGWTNCTIKKEEYIEDRTELNDRHDAILDNWNANVKAEHPYDGFNFNTEPVTTQVAAVDAVVATYYGPLTNGVVEDVEKSFNEFKEMLDKAGIRDIIAELEKQAAEHVAAN